MYYFPSHGQTEVSLRYHLISNCQLKFVQMMMMTPAGLLKNMFLNKNAILPWQIETAQEHYRAIFKANALTIFKVPLSLKYKIDFCARSSASVIYC